MVKTSKNILALLILLSLVSILSGCNQKMRDTFNNILSSGTNKSTNDNTNYQSNPSPSSVPKQTPTTKPTSTPKPTPTNKITPTPLSKAGGSKNNNSDGVSVDLKEFLDTYEAFVDDYIAFMKNYMNSLFSLDIIGIENEYQEMEAKLNEYEEKMNSLEPEMMSLKDYEYYMDALIRIESKFMNMLY